MRSSGELGAGPREQDLALINEDIRNGLISTRVPVKFRG